MNFMQGLIGGVITGGAKGVHEIAEQGLEKENKLDLARQMADIDFEKQRRIDEYHTSEDYLKRQGAADLTKGRILAQNRTTLAPETAAADEAEYNAKRPLAKKTAEDAEGDERDLFKKRWGDKGYIEATRTKTAAGESSATRASAAETGVKIEREREINATLKALKDPNLTDEQRGQLTQRLSLLRNSSGDAAYPYQVVPTRDEDGNVIGQRVFDRVHGKWVEEGAGGGGAAPAPGGASAPAPGGKKPWEKY